MTRTTAHWPGVALVQVIETTWWRDERDLSASRLRQQIPQHVPPPTAHALQGLLVQGADIAVQHLHLHGADRWQLDTALRTQTVCSWLDWQRDSAMRRGERASDLRALLALQWQADCQTPEEANTLQVSLHWRDPPEPWRNQTWHGQPPPPRHRANLHPGQYLRWQEQRQRGVGHVRLTVNVVCGPWATAADALRQPPLCAWQD